jgi:phage terminase small subunit
MQILNSRQRAFILALFQLPPKHGSQTQALKMAGYICKSPQVYAAQASRLIHDEKIQRALQEHGQKVLRAGAPRALAALASLVEDSTHKDHARAIEMTLSRVYPTETVHQVQVSHEHKVAIDPGKVMARISELMAKAGLPPMQEPVLIEATATRVEDGDDAAD